MNRMSRIRITFPEAARNVLMRNLEEGHGGLLLPIGFNLPPCL
jgi:hypothetical protein